jgi:hypothetical protein
VNKIIVAIGGGENGRILEDGTIAPYETENIDKEIVKMTNKEIGRIGLSMAINYFTL